MPQSSLLQTPTTPALYIAECVTYALIGFALGSLIDNAVRRLQPNTSRSASLAWLLAQLLAMSLVVLSLEMCVSKPFAQSWQITTAGLFFVATYFGSQTRLYANAQRVMGADSAPSSLARAAVAMDKTDRVK